MCVFRARSLKFANFWLLKPSFCCSMVDPSLNLMGAALGLMSNVELVKM